ncbi:MAG: hypothetical protein V2I76_15845, partial [Roseobacter sp.]|nr:hypothetical protein [Roseobacter sp.]
SIPGLWRAVQESGGGRQGPQDIRALPGIDLSFLLFPTNAPSTGPDRGSAATPAAPFPRVDRP